MGHSTEYLHLDQDALGDDMPPAPEPCFCDGPWAGVEPELRPESPTAREHKLGEAGCKYGRKAEHTAEVAEGLNYMVDVTVDASLTDTEIRRQIAGLLREQADRLEQEEGPIER